MVQQDFICIIVFSAVLDSKNADTKAETLPTEKCIDLKTLPPSRRRRPESFSD